MTVIRANAFRTGTVVLALLSALSCTSGREAIPAACRVSAGQEVPCGSGLVGYSCDGPVYRLAQGVRRLVLLDLEPGSSTDEIEALIAKETAPRVSVFAENTFGAAWMDGITPITGRPPWSHLWEQGWDDLAAFEAWRDGTSPMAEVERAGWDGLARRAGSVHYKLITA